MGFSFGKKGNTQPWRGLVVPVRESFADGKAAQWCAARDRTSGIFRRRMGRSKLTAAKAVTPAYAGKLWGR